MQPRELIPDIFCVGAIDWDRRLFDSLIPLPDGTSYNSYLVKGKEKTALIDTVDPPKTDILEANLQAMDIKTIDYIITHHAEQDHSGALPRILEKYPEAKAVCTPRCKELLASLLAISEDRIVTVEDKESISLGGKTLEFIHFPWVHWPETMLSYLKEDRILFPCDLFGAHLAASDLYVTDEGQAYESAKRYYAEIMMPFRTNIQKSWPKLDGYTIDMIAPSHGPIHRKPEFIMSAYKDWVFSEPKNTVVLPYISMHGSTRMMVNHLVEAIMGNGVTVKQFDLTVTDIGKLAMELVDAATIVLGVPTVLAGAHPNAIYAAFLANALKPKAKFAAIIGSYGWGGKAVEQLTGLIPNLKVEVLGTVLCKGLPQEADYKALDELAANIARKHQEAGIK
ncbi:MAG TPA: FprA family A-type flavoprotein [Dehalococcoidia bacterium]|nr:FprA family A-type flavoprotein [Dehalococcoidia bacterium]